LRDRYDLFIKNRLVETVKHPFASVSDSPVASPFCVTAFYHTAFYFGQAYTHCNCIIVVVFLVSDLRRMAGEKKI